MIAALNGDVDNYADLKALEAVTTDKDSMTSLFFELGRQRSVSA